MTEPVKFEDEVGEKQGGCGLEGPLVDLHNKNAGKVYLLPHYQSCWNYHCTIPCDHVVHLSR